MVLLAYKFDGRLGREILDRGADILAEPQGTRISVLHVAAKYGNEYDVRDLLQRAARHFRSQIRDAREADRRIIDWVNQTIDLDANAEFKVNGYHKLGLSHGFTALHGAADDLKTGTLQVLVEYGADPSIRNRQGKTAQNILDDRLKTNSEALVRNTARERLRAEQAEEDRREASATRQGVLAVLGSVAIAKGMAGRNYTDDQRRSVTEAYVRDRANAANGGQSNNFGQAAEQVKSELDLAAMARQRDLRNQRNVQNLAGTQVATANQERSQPQIQTQHLADYDALNAAPGQKVNPRTQVTTAAQPTVAPKISGGRSPETRSGQACGPSAKCRAGDGFVQWCSGPPVGRDCKSECRMTSGVSYHDVSLPTNVAYIPSDQACGVCDVPNPCN